MAKQRDVVRMSEAEVAAFLDAAHSLQVATIGKDGAPHLTTVWFGVKDGEILFETYGKSQKVINLRRDPRIAVLAEKGETYAELRGVSINGTARIIDAGALLVEAMEFLMAVHFPDMTAAEVAEAAAKMADKRVVLAVRPERVMSWDHRKLGGKGPF